MADFKLTSYLPSLPAEALKKAIEQKGNTVEEILRSKLEELYEEFVPQSERDRIVEAIARDETERKKDLEGYCIIQLHDKKDDCFFMLDDGSNAYTIASTYFHYYNDNVEEYDLNSLAHGFGEVEFLSKKSYDSLVRAMERDRSIRAAMEFDFEKSILRIYNAQDNEWKAYDFMDVDISVNAAEEDLSASTIQKARKFWAELEDREIVEALEMKG